MASPKIYAYEGEQFQQFGGTKPEGAILMKGPRPAGGIYFAMNNGEWELISSNQESAAKRHRDEVKDSPIEVFGVFWDIDRESRDNIDNAIWSLQWYPEGTTMDWILEDNTTRSSTLEDLKRVKLAYGERLDRIYAQYRVWRKGDRHIPFEYQA